MVTIKQVYQKFGSHQQWRMYANASLQSMTSVILRKYGSTDIEDVNDFTLNLWIACSEQPVDRKAKARSCMEHMMKWAEENDIYHGQFSTPDVPVLTEKEPEKSKPAKVLTEKEPERLKPAKVLTEKEPERLKPAKVLTEKEPERSKPAKKEPKPKPTVKKAIADYDKMVLPTKYTGTIYYDSSIKEFRNCSRRYKNCWRAEITIDGQRFRHRSQDRLDCEEWLKAVREGIIKPTDNKADWWRMEQHKDESVRIEEIIASAAEESGMLMEYHKTGNIDEICNYVNQRLIPHMAYYCAHTLKLGATKTQIASKQAIALLLTRIASGRPVINFTATCKRMLRLYKSKGDFFYYEYAPKDVKLVVNNIDFSQLENVWKVTKDRRI